MYSRLIGLVLPEFCRPYPHPQASCIPWLQQESSILGHICIKSFCRQARAYQSFGLSYEIMSFSPSLLVRICFVVEDCQGLYPASLTPPFVLLATSLALIHIGAKLTRVLSEIDSLPFIRGSKFIQSRQIVF